MEPRLKSRMWIQSLIRRCDLAAISAAVVARGDDDAGAILLKFNSREGGCSVLAQARGPEGELNPSHAAVEAHCRRISERVLLSSASKDRTKSA